MRCHHPPRSTKVYSAAPKTPGMNRAPNPKPYAGNPRTLHYLRAEAGIENPRVIKSPFAPPFLSFVNKLSIFSLRPIIFRFLFFSFSSFKTRAVSEAVAEFLIPLAAPFDFDADMAVAAAVPLGASVELSVACFLRFLEPGAFLRECVRPCSASLAPRAIRRSLSASFVGRMVMMLSSV